MTRELLVALQRTLKAGRVAFGRRRASPGAWIPEEAPPAEGVPPKTPPEPSGAPERPETVEE